MQFLQGLAHLTDVFPDVVARLHLFDVSLCIGDCVA